MQPWRNSGWTRRLVVVVLSIRSYLSARTTEQRQRTTPKALISHSRSRRSGNLTWIVPRPMPRRQFSLWRKTALNCPAATVVPRHLLRAGIGAAGGQTRGLLHLRILNADHAAYPVAIGGEIGAAQHTGSSAGLYPLSRGGGLHGGAGRSDIAAEANDEVKIQLFSSDFGNL